MRVRFIIGLAGAAGVLAFTACGGAAQHALLSIAASNVTSNHTPAPARPATDAGPSTYEEQARTQDQVHTQPQQISVGPSVYEQQVRTRMPGPSPTPISAGPGRH